MHGLMQDMPLTLDHMLRRAETYFGHKSILTPGPDGNLETVSYAQMGERSRRLAGALDLLGITGPVGTFAWNSARHMEIYFGVPCSGRLLHTVNIRLFADQIAYVINHAEDEALFVDSSLLSLVEPLLPQLTSLRHLVIMDDDGKAGPSLPRFQGIEVIGYEELLATSEPIELRVQDEQTAAIMCYTSGTTGDPKGVVYSHRSLFLHTMAVTAAGVLGIHEADRVLPVVPMFHSNAWGLPYAAAGVGADLIMPGADMSGEAVADLIVEQRVTVAAGVPTIWIRALDFLRGRDTSALRLIPCGGAAVPASLSEAYREVVGLPIQQAWGMTEAGPVAVIGRLDGDQELLSDEEKASLRTGVGRAALGVECRLANPDTGAPVPSDGVSRGELQVRGPWIAAAYFQRDDAGDSFTEDGWLRSGDVATMDERGWIRLVDRTKDLIKSGGEWISSVDLENRLMGHPAVLEAAVIGIPDPQWSERPLACVVVEPGHELTAEEVVAYLSTDLPKWQLPQVVFIDEVPKTSVGKFSKLTLRERFASPDGAAAKTIVDA